MSDAVTGHGWRFDMPRFSGPALCAETDPDAFFPEKGESAREAKQICAECQVRAECLAWALSHDEAGVWGGTSEFERRSLVRRRRALPVREINHGTVGGYRTHHRRGEKPCDACRSAESIRNAEVSARRRDGAA